MFDIRISYMECDENGCVGKLRKEDMICLDFNNIQNTISRAEALSGDIVSILISKRGSYAD